MSFESPKDNLEQLTLAQLAQLYLLWKYAKVQEAVQVEGLVDSCQFDFVVSCKAMVAANSGETGAIVRDWKRTCGVNVIISFEHRLKAVRSTISHGIIIANRFSSSAQALAEKANIALLSRGELVSTFRNQQIPIDLDSLTRRN